MPSNPWLQPPTSHHDEPSGTTPHHHPPPQPQQPTPPAFHPYPSEPPGGRFYGQIVEAEHVRLLLPLERVVIHIMDHNFVKGLPHGNFQPWVFFPALTISDLFASLGIETGVREHQYTGAGTFVPSQKILVSDPRVGKKLAEIGWVPGRGINSKPVWLEILR
ncbi:MAG: hypothetical protein Q9186_006082 [Xanthomendoza sp. 1 TL-2023]